MATKLGAQPGWTTLRRAAEELHAADLLIGDPVAPARTAVPHLRAFWAGVAEAAAEAEVGADASTAETWLGAEIPGVSAKDRARLLDHVRSLGPDSTADPSSDSSPGPTDAEFRDHAKAAHALLAALESAIGGAPLATRRRRLLWTSVSLVIVFAPVLTYVALNTTIEGEGPWRASYFTDRKLESKAIVQRETTVDHDWGKDAPLEAVPPDKFSVRFDTCLRVEDSGMVTFQVNANDGARVFVDGETVIDAWEKTPTNPRRGFGTTAVELEAGVHHLRVEYFESMGTASVRLAASFDETLPAPLASSRLIYPGDDLDEDDPCAAVR